MECRRQGQDVGGEGLTDVACIPEAEDRKTGSRGKGSKRSELPAELTRTQKAGPLEHMGACGTGTTGASEKSRWVSYTRTVTARHGSQKEMSSHTLENTRRARMQTTKEADRKALLDWRREAERLWAVAPERRCWSDQVWGRHRAATGSGRESIACTPTGHYGSL